MKTVIVLAAHGAPPTDYPPQRVGMLMALEFAPRRITHLGFLRAKRAALDREVRTWRRTGENDPYKNGVEQLAAQIAKHAGLPVIVGYNEFCAPTIAEAIDHAAQDNATQVIVATTMLTRGGEHSEIEIRALVEAAQARHPQVRIVYAWPPDGERVAQLFAAEVKRFA